MPYIERDSNGVVKGVFSNPQEGYAEEWLEDNAAEVLGYLTPPPTDDELRAEAFKADPARVDMLTRLTTATPVQIDAYIEASVTNLAQVRSFLKAMTKVIALIARD